MTQDLFKMRPILGKGYPEYDPDEVRGDDGRWAGEGRARGKTKPVGNKAAVARGKGVGSKLNKLRSQINQARQRAERFGPSRSQEAGRRLRADMAPIRQKAYDLIDTLAKEPPDAAYAAVQVINARKVKSRKAAIDSMKREVNGWALDAQRVLTAGLSRPW